MMKQMNVGHINVGIVAPSAVVPQIEFEQGVACLLEAGFGVQVHPQVRRRHLFFAGTDQERADAFLAMAQDPSIDVIWCARGGYGAARLLPFLDRKTRAHLGSKLLVGYSDATALMEYVRTRWGWKTLHAPMPGLRDFSSLKRREWQQLMDAVFGVLGKSPLEVHHRLRFFGKPPVRPVVAPVVGGNLSVWVSLVGTPFAGQAKGKILFLEDVSESLYRVDRMVQQLVASGGLKGVRAIVLGTFHDCEDSVPVVLERHVMEGEKSPTRPLRPRISRNEGLRAIFGALGEQLGVPIAYGVPSGHGVGHFPLPLGQKFRLARSGLFEAL